MITRDTEKFNKFIETYWRYYLQLEEEFFSVRKYIEFNTGNNAAYSIEFLKLQQAVCSEIDVVGKALARLVNPGFQYKDSNITKWWHEIQDVYYLTDSYSDIVATNNPKSHKSIKYYNVLFCKIISVTPWEGFEVERYQDKKSRTRYRLKRGMQTPKWWTSYNKVKHLRTEPIDGKTTESNYTLANFKNVYCAFAALYVLEKAYIEAIGTLEDLEKLTEISLLFDEGIALGISGKEISEIFQNARPFNVGG